MTLEEDLQEKLRTLQSTCSVLSKDCALKHALQQLIDDIRFLNARWIREENKAITYSFFSTVANKVSGNRRLVPPVELVNLCEKTLYLLYGTLSAASYNEYASTIEGQASTEMKNIAMAMLAVGFLFLLSTILTPGILMGSLTVASLLVSGFLYSRSGLTGLANESNEVCMAYKEYVSQPQP